MPAGWLESAFFTRKTSCLTLEFMLPRLPQFLVQAQDQGRQLHTAQDPPTGHTARSDILPMVNTVLGVSSPVDTDATRQDGDDGACHQGGPHKDGRAVGVCTEPSLQSTEHCVRSCLASTASAAQRPVCLPQIMIFGVYFLTSTCTDLVLRRYGPYLVVCQLNSRSEDTMVGPQATAQQATNLLTAGGDGSAAAGLRSARSVLGILAAAARHGDRRLLRWWDAARVTGQLRTHSTALGQSVFACACGFPCVCM